MIVTTLAARRAYRMHTPRWAVAPASGAGAAQHGGRVNRPGLEALYLALEVETAIAEYQQRSTLMPPGLLIEYSITADRIVDFRDGYRSDAWPESWQDFHCDWRALWFHQRIEPPSWAIGDALTASGHKGVLFASQLRAGGVNLVLYPSQLTRDDRIDWHDPGNELPRNQRSWDPDERP